MKLKITFWHRIKQRVTVQAPPDPSRQELITQITDVIGPSVAIRPSRNQQIGRAVLSFLIRSAAFSYTGYLAMLFNSRFGNESTRGFTFGPKDYGMLGLMLAVLSFFVFRKVYGDRLTPVGSMLKRFLGRMIKIVVVFLFWTAMFSNFGELGKNEFMLLLGTIFIFSSGYDCRLTAPRPRTDSSSNS